MKIVKSHLFVVSFIFIISCDKEELSNRPMSQAAIWDCYNKSSWNDTQIREELIGQWRWIYTENFWVPEEGRNTENEKMEIAFFRDSTLLVTLNDKAIFTTGWKVVPEDGDLYGLALDSAFSQLYGRILICADIVEFNNSYIDGSDNYFKRIK